MSVEFMLQKPPIMQTRLRLRMVERTRGAQPAASGKEWDAGEASNLCARRRRNPAHSPALNAEGATPSRSMTVEPRHGTQRGADAEQATPGVWGTPCSFTARARTRSSLELTMAPRRRWETNRTGVVR